MSPPRATACPERAVPRRRTPAREMISEGSGDEATGPPGEGASPRGEYRHVRPPGTARACQHLFLPAPETRRPMAGIGHDGPATGRMAPRRAFGSGPKKADTPQSRRVDASVPRRRLVHAGSISQTNPRLKGNSRPSSDQRCRQLLQDRYGEVRLGPEGIEVRHELEETNGPVGGDSGLGGKPRWLLGWIRLAVLAAMRSTAAEGGRGAAQDVGRGDVDSGPLTHVHWSSTGEPRARRVCLPTDRGQPLIWLGARGNLTECRPGAGGRPR